MSLCNRLLFSHASVTDTDSCVDMSKQNQKYHHVFPNTCILLEWQQKFDHLFSILGIETPFKKSNILFDRVSCTHIHRCFEQCLFPHCLWVVHLYTLSTMKGLR